MSRESEIVDLIRAQVGVHIANLAKRWEKDNMDAQQRAETLRIMLLAGLDPVIRGVTAYGDHEIIRACVGICSKMQVKIPLEDLKEITASARRQAQYVPDIAYSLECQENSLARHVQPSERHLDQRLKTVKSWSRASAFEFGIEALDSEFHGIQPGEMCIVNGAQGSMKTSFALGGMENALRKGFSVMFFSLDMEPGELQERRILRRTRYAQAFYFYLLQSGDTAEIDKAREDINELDRGRFYLFGAEREDSGERMTVDDVKSAIETIRPNVVIVDYITLLRRAGQSDLDCVNEVMPAMKSLTQKLKIRTILLSQMSRASKSEQAKGVVGGHAKGGGIVEELTHTEIELIKDVSQNPYKPDIIATITKARRGASHISYSLEVDVQSMCFLGGAARVYRDNKSSGKPLFTRQIPAWDEDNA
jgi:KaiC/GvpD/RAD55 family RecA-like ATPase